MMDIKSDKENIYITRGLSGNESGRCDVQGTNNVMQRNEEDMT